MSRLILCATALALLFGASGCVVYSVADTAVSVTADVVETGVDVTTGAVSAVIP